MRKRNKNQSLVPWMLSLFFDNLLEEPFKKGKKLVNFKRAYHHDMGKVVIVPLSFSSSKFQSKRRLHSFVSSG